MTLLQRAYRGESDWHAVAGLIQADPHFFHRVDFGWRLCSTTLADMRNAAVWEDEHGQMQVFAALQFPWLTFDYAIHPAVRSPELEMEILAWADKRLQAIAAESGDDFPFNVSAWADDTARIQFLESRGYARWEHHMVALSRPLADIPEPLIPPGFIIRPLDGAREVDAYVELHRTAFESTTMTTRWRGQTLHTPLYNPNLDLVAVAPDGRLAGFCIWWVSPALKIAQIEPLGVHPDFQHLGLSQALMVAGMHRAALSGADHARVETYSFSEPALKAYEAAGFRPVGHELKFYKEYAPR